MITFALIITVFILFILLGNKLCQLMETMIIGLPTSKLLVLIIIISVLIITIISNYDAIITLLS